MKLCKWEPCGDVHIYHNTVRRHNGNFWKALCGQDNEKYRNAEIFESEEKEVTCWKCKTVLRISETPIKDKVVQDVLRRMVESELKHPGWPEKIGDGYCIVASELGEVAKAMLNRNQFHVKDELLDVASSTIRFLLYIYEAEEKEENLEM
jgi:hypothetical protein